jgi:hypothetical protein
MLNMFVSTPYASECEEGKALYVASRTTAALHHASLSPIGISPEHAAYTHHVHRCPLCLHRNDQRETQTESVTQKLIA